MEISRKWEPPVPGKQQPSPEPDGPDSDYPVPGELPPEPMDVCVSYG
jgi:hypothetical protein